MRFDVITIFPQMFEKVFDYGVIKKAKEKNILEINIWNLREFANPPHREVDDYPYGGGVGMVLKVEPIFKAVEKIHLTQGKVILLSPRGEIFTQKKAKELSKEKQIIFICGRYQGVDERVREGIADITLSIGNYILAGGEFAAMVIIESIVRLLPGVVGNYESVLSDSENKLDPPLYTRPREFQGMKVPEVLLSGNHKEIEHWKEERRSKW
jgi:tRNA (guanine37-N1)-methyltransferase